MLMTGGSNLLVPSFVYVGLCEYGLGCQTQVDVSIDVISRLVWRETDVTGLDWFCSADKSHLFSEGTPLVDRYSTWNQRA